jgi:hypothetical protein
MEHRFICKQCGGILYSYCFEYQVYTEPGWETRKRQIDARLCNKCFGEVPELRTPENKERWSKTVLVELSD